MNDMIYFLLISIGLTLTRSDLNYWNSDIEFSEIDEEENSCKCPKKPFTAPSGMIKSPKDAKNDLYCSSMECVYDIKVPQAPNQQLVVTFNNFSTEYGYDFLEFHDGENDYYLGSLSGPSLPLYNVSDGPWFRSVLAPLTVGNNHMRLVFKTDKNMNLPGFQVQYFSYKKGFCEAVSIEPGDRKEFKRGPKGMSITSSVKTPNWPFLYYPPGFSCDYDFIVPFGYEITVTFDKKSQIADKVDYSKIYCNNGTIDGEYTGKEFPGARTFKDSFRVSFSSRASPKANPGFQLDWILRKSVYPDDTDFLGCKVDLFPLQYEKFSSETKRLSPKCLFPGVSSFLPSRLAFSRRFYRPDKILYLMWSIGTSEGSVLGIYVQHFHLTSSPRHGPVSVSQRDRSDNVYIYDGLDSTSKLLQKCTGKTCYSIKSISNFITIVFESHPGFGLYRDDDELYLFDFLFMEIQQKK